jgi:hypothetical protein
MKKRLSNHSKYTLAFLSVILLFFFIFQVIAQTSAPAPNPGHKADELSVDGYSNIQNAINSLDSDISNLQSQINALGSGGGGGSGATNYITFSTPNDNTLTTYQTIDTSSLGINNWLDQRVELTCDPTNFDIPANPQNSYLSQIPNLLSQQPEYIRVGSGTTGQPPQISQTDPAIYNNHYITITETEQESYRLRARTGGNMETAFMRIRTQPGDNTILEATASTSITSNPQLNWECYITTIN